MAQYQLRKPQPTRGTRGGAFAYCGSHLSHAEPQFTPVYWSPHPRTPQGATKPFTAENSPDHLNYYIAAYGFLVAERNRFSPSARVGNLGLSAPEPPPDFRPRGSRPTRAA